MTKIIIVMLVCLVQERYYVTRVAPYQGKQYPPDPKAA